MSEEQSSPLSVLIIIPAYNAGGFLKEAIDSSLEQTYQHQRVVVINDASTDGTAELLSGYRDDSRLEVITNERNLGKATSLNLLIDSAEEDLVALMDADDVMYPDRIEKQVGFMLAHPKVGASSGFMDYISGEGRKIGRAKLDLLSDEVAQRYVSDSDPFAIFCPCAILRRTMLHETGLRFRGQFWPADDIDMWNRIYESGWQVIVQEDVLMQYRIHGTSIVTSSFLKTRRQFEFVRACMRARRNNEPEPTSGEFTAMMQNRPALVRFNSWRKTYAKGLYRGAGFAVAERRLLRAAWMLGVAVCLQTGYVVNRFKQQVLKK